MLGERVLGSQASYLGRLGALSALLCGACTLPAAALLALEPALGNVLALATCLVVAVAGACVARRG